MATDDRAARVGAEAFERLANESLEYCIANRTEADWSCCYACKKAIALRQAAQTERERVEMQKELHRWRCGAQRVENGKTVIDMMDLLKESARNA